MSERRRLHPVLAASFVAGSSLAVMGAAIVTACGSADLAATRSVGARPAGMTVATEPSAYTAGQLRAAPLPDVQTSRQTMTGVTVTPARCAQATMTAFHAPAFAAAPAAVVTFLVGRDGVSEVLVSAPPRLAETALGGLLPAGCDRYTATVDGETFGYQAREVPLPGLAEQARALSVRATGYPDVDIWSVVYRASGFVGAITMVGPDATEQGVKQLAIQAYATADRVLSGV